MENASKALIMAAGILIGVLILSLTAYLIATFGASSAEIQKINEEKIISEFNSQFTVYDGRKDLTIYDVITAANYAKENNEKYGLDAKSRFNQDSYYVKVFYNNYKNSSAFLESMDLSMQNELLEADRGEKYSCIVNISSTTKRVYNLIFQKE